MFDKIDFEDETVEEARRSIVAALKEGCEGVPNRIYEAFRNWTWRMLTGRRFDLDLPRWHDLIRSASSLMSERHVNEATRLRVLSELVLQSVRFAEANPRADVAKREHVARIISILTNAPKREVQRAALLHLTGLKQANLSRILSTMESSGMIERRSNGRFVIIALPGLAAQTINKMPEIKPNDFDSLHSIHDIMFGNRIKIYGHQRNTKRQAAKAAHLIAEGTLTTRQKINILSSHGDPLANSYIHKANASDLIINISGVPGLFQSKLEEKRGNSASGYKASIEPIADNRILEVHYSRDYKLVSPVDSNKKLGNSIVFHGEAVGG